MVDTPSLRQGNEAHAAAPAAASGSARATAKADHARAMNLGYSTAMGRGLELAVTLAVMVGVGWFVDRLFGTAPLFTIVFSVLGFAGITVKLWLGYDLEMKKQEDGAIWNRKAGAAQ